MTENFRGVNGEGSKREKQQVPAGWIEQPTSSLRVTRSTTELSGLLLGRLLGALCAENAIPVYRAQMHVCTELRVDVRRSSSDIRARTK